MFDRPSTKRAPWHLVSGEYKWYARIRTLEIIADRLAKGVDLEPPPADPATAKAIKSMLRKAKKGGRGLKP